MTNAEFANDGSFLDKCKLYFMNRATERVNEKGETITISGIVGVSGYRQLATKRQASKFRMCKGRIYLNR